MSAYNFSGPAEILRAEQKDEELCKHINQQLSELLLQLKGHIFINKNKQYILCASKVLYYTLTTLSNLQTLGEEYTKIVQVGRTGKHVPGYLQSVGMISAHVFGDQLISLALDGFIDYVKKNKSITVQSKNQIVHFLTVVKSLVPLFQSLNTVLFYWNSSFYTWAKRIFNIKYIYAIPWYHPKRPLHVFKILSVLTAIHLSVLLLTTLYKNRNIQNNDEIHISEHNPLNNNKCSLCLEQRRNTSLSFCGHLFCWHCIHEWLQTNDFCPICRKKLTPRKIIPLQNFV